MVTEVWTIKQQFIDGKHWAKERGREEGRKEEREKAESDKLESARNFLSMGMSADDVARGLSLDLKTIKNLK